MIRHFAILACTIGGGLPCAAQQPIVPLAVSRVVSVHGSSGISPSGSYYQGGSELGLFDEELRIRCGICADECFPDSFPCNVQAFARARQRSTVDAGTISADLGISVNISGSGSLYAEATSSFEYHFDVTQTARLLLNASHTVSSFSRGPTANIRLDGTGASFSTTFGTSIFETQQLTGTLPRGRCSIRVECRGGSDNRIYSPATDVQFTLTLTPCPQDFNGDGAIEGDDLAEFVGCYFTSDTCNQADFNGDDDVNADDLADFINAYFSPPC